MMIVLARTALFLCLLCCAVGFTPSLIASHPSKATDSSGIRSQRSSSWLGSFGFHPPINKGLSLHNNAPKHSNGNDPSSWSPQLVIPLWLLYVSNQWTRNSISGLVNFDSNSGSTYAAMNLELNFNESQYAILASIAFTSLFAICSVLAGSIIDASERPNQAAKQYSVAAGILWSLTAVAIASASSYEQLVAARVIMGLACAFTTPAAYTWINRAVDTTQRSTATSIYGTGVALGSALSSITLILDERLGWRNTMELIAVVGFSIAAVAGLALPSDDADDDETTATTKRTRTATMTESKKNPVETLTAGILTSLETERAVWIYIASLFRFSAGLCIGVWSAPFFRMAFDNNMDVIDSYAVSQGLISAVGASLSGIIGGTIADRIMAKDESLQNQRLYIPVVGSLLAAPAWYMAIHTASTDTFATSMTWLAVEYFVAECWFGPTISVLQATVAAGGTAQGLFTLTGAVANLAPTALGVAVSSDLEGTGLLELLTAGVCGSYVISSLCFLMAIRAPDPAKVD